MTDTKKLKELAELATATRPDWYTEDGNNWFLPRDCMNWIAAANPQAILGLIERLEKAEQHWANENSNNMALIAEVERLRQFAAEIYQVLGALDAPENVLDNASDAANGAPLRHETLLPFFAEDYEALRKDAERYRWLRVQPNDCTAPRIDVVRWEPMDESANEGEGLRFEALDAAIDAALEGDGR
ncbi:hypothetical protein N7403_20680 [Pseudomonas nitroreducens]|uniref:hypothetical protein n=1 Tax=Pseudomonas nitroreducens TaxID=46680 RepID=UPI00244891F6|nr:hypothetical protein [Pseudomonas nitroreducens]MDG9856289.1 hypothetical protein [Pseudomonas nitroreducens]